MTILTATVRHGNGIRVTDVRTVLTPSAAAIARQLFRIKYPGCTITAATF